MIAKPRRNAAALPPEPGVAKAAARSPRAVARTAAAPVQRLTSFDTCVNGGSWSWGKKGLRMGGGGEEERCVRACCVNGLVC